MRNLDVSWWFPRASGKALINLLQNSTTAWPVGIPNPYLFLGAPGSASSWRFLPPTLLLYLTAVPPDVKLPIRSLLVWNTEPSQVESSPLELERRGKESSLLHVFSLLGYLGRVAFYLPSLCREEPAARCGFYLLKTVVSCTSSPFIFQLHLDDFIQPSKHSHFTDEATEA